MSIIRTAECRRKSILVLMCATAISSCGDDGASTQPTTAASGANLPSAEPFASSVVATEATGGVDGPVVYTAVPDLPGAEAAAATGTLELVGQCLLVGGADVGRRTVLVWPFGTTWSDDQSAVIQPDQSAVPIGSKISAGGGERQAGHLEEFLSDPEALERINDCVEFAATENVFVIQDDGRGHPVEVIP
jgi:hypothetical protein